MVWLHAQVTSQICVIMLLLTASKLLKVNFLCMVQHKMKISHRSRFNTKWKFHIDQGSVQNENCGMDSAMKKNELNYYYYWVICYIQNLITVYKYIVVVILFNILLGAKFAIGQKSHTCSLIFSLFPLFFIRCIIIANIKFISFFILTAYKLTEENSEMRKTVWPNFERKKEKKSLKSFFKSPPPPSNNVNGCWKLYRYIIEWQSKTNLLEKVTAI